MNALRTFCARYGLDVLAVGGAVLVALGLGLYSPPLAPIVLGLGLIATARFGSH